MSSEQARLDGLKGALDQIKRRIAEGREEAVAECGLGELVLIGGMLAITVGPAEGGTMPMVVAGDLALLAKETAPVRRLVTIDQVGTLALAYLTLAGVCDDAGKIPIAD